VPRTDVPLSRWILRSRIPEIFAQSRSGVPNLYQSLIGQERSTGIGTFLRDSRWFCCGLNGGNPPRPAYAISSPQRSQAIDSPRERSVGRSVVRSSIGAHSGLQRCARSNYLLCRQRIWRPRNMPRLGLIDLYAVSFERGSRSERELHPR